MTSSRAGRLAAVTFSVVVALALAELALRAFAPIYTVGIQKSYEYDSVLGVRLKPGFHATRMTDHLEEITTNKLGVIDFRENYVGYPELAFALGDSYTQGTGLPTDMSYPAQLDQIVNRAADGRYERRVAVLNLGLGSYGGEQSLLVLQRFTKSVGKPAWCLYAGSDNDYDDDLLFKRGGRHRQLVRGTPRWKGFAEALGAVSNLQLVLRLKIPLAQRRLDAIRADAASGEESPAQISIAEREWPVIERIVSACAAAGGRTIVTWIPPGNMVSYDWAKRKSAERGIPFNDWYPRVASAIAAIPQLPEDNPHSGGHHRGWVAAQVAAGFRDEMSSLRPTEKLSSSPSGISR